MLERIADTEAPAWVISKSDPQPNGCWSWTGGRHQRYGGQGGDRAMQGNRTAARVMWEQLRGVLPRALVVRHECDNAMCIRPSHLLLGTHQQNTQDASRRGRLRPGGQAMLTL